MGLAGAGRSWGSRRLGTGERRAGQGYSRPQGLAGGKGPLSRWKRPPPAIRLFRRIPSPPGSPRLLWGTRRRFDPSSSPSARLPEAAYSPGELAGNYSICETSNVSLSSMFERDPTK
jgi:hypothetical protein